MSPVLSIFRRATATVAPLLVLLVASGPAHAVDIQRVVSPSGIEAWLVEDHTVPLVALNFSFNGGSVQDPIGKEGLTRLLTASLDEGAGELNSEDFQAKMEELAISIGFRAGKDRFFGSLTTLTNTLEQATDMLSLALTEPRFDNAPVERMKTQLMARVRSNEQNPDAIAGRSFMQAVLPGHPYSRQSLGSEASLQSITRDDLRLQQKRLMTKDGMKIGVVGAIAPERLAPLLDKVFGNLPETSELQQIADISMTSGADILNPLAVPQTTIMIGYPGVTRTDPDYQAAYVMNHILGGGSFTSWIYQEVREKRGLSYSAGTSLSTYLHTGMLVGTAATKAERADETVDVMLAQFRRMAENGPTADELDAAKKYLTGSYPLRFDSSGKIARQLVALQNANLGIDYFDRRNAEIEAVTLEDIKRVAKRLIASVQPTIVRVGPATN